MLHQDEEGEDAAMTNHEKLMLARHLERAARAYEADAEEVAKVLDGSGSIQLEAAQQCASEARTYAALLRKGIKVEELPGLHLGLGAL
jgi:predicted kinase